MSNYKLSQFTHLGNGTIRDFFQVSQVNNEQILIFVVGSQDVAGIHNLSNKQSYIPLNWHTFTAACTTLDNYAYIGDADGNALAYDLNKQEIHSFMKLSQARICSIVPNYMCDLEAYTLSCGSWDGSVYVVQKENLSIMSRFAHQAMNYAVCCAYIFGTQICGSSLGHIIYVRDGLTTHLEYKLHNDIIRKIIQLAKLPLFCTCSNDGYVKFLNYNTYECLLSVHASDEFIYTVQPVQVKNSNVFDVFTGGESCIRYFKISISDDNLSMTLINEPELLWKHNCSIWCSTELTYNNNQTSVLFGTDKGDILEFSTRNLLDDKQIELIKAEINKSIHIDGNNTTDNNKATNKEGITSNKTYYKGDSIFLEGYYDYVFDILVEDSNAQLKLPFNNSDDYEYVAAKFCKSNNFNSSTTKDIIKFLRENTNNSKPINNIQEKLSDVQFWNPTNSSNIKNINKAFDKLKEILTAKSNFEIECNNLTVAYNSTKKANNLVLCDYPATLIYFFFANDFIINDIERAARLCFFDISRILLLSRSVIKYIINKLHLMNLLHKLISAIDGIEDNTSLVILRCILNISTHKLAVNYCIHINWNEIYKSELNNQKIKDTMKAIISNLTSYVEINDKTNTTKINELTETLNKYS